MLRLFPILVVLLFAVTACKKQSEPVKSDGNAPGSASINAKKAASSDDPMFKIAEQSRKTMDDAKQLEEEMKKAAEAQRKAIDAQEKAIEEAK